MKLSNTEKDRLQSKYGNWALVTGASSGIGKELTQQLASAGFNLVIAARRKGVLYEIAADLQAAYPIKVHTVAGDLSQQPEVENLIEAVREIPLGLAILNAGFGTSGKFIESDIDKEVNMLDLNCRSLLMLSHHFAQQFAKKQKGGIILLSSLVGFQGVPNAANYAATKAYVQSLGEALAVELKPHKVDVLCAAPGPVNTSFSERANMQMGNVLKPEDIGVPILKALGRKTTVLPGTLTKILTYSLRTVPRWAKVKIMNQVMGGMTKHQQHSASSMT
ncbi:MAG: SDR family NAD(P)-dependent oxidoreductase [Bacteroidota bacterium]